MKGREYIVCISFPIFSFGLIYASAYDLLERVENLEQLALRVKSSIATNQKDFYKLETRSQEEHAGIERKEERRALNSVIGFDAWLDVPKHLHLGDTEAIVFNHVHENLGSGYNVTNGRFTCPHHGIYQFASNIASDNNVKVDCEMVKDGQQVVRLRGESPGFDQASQVVVLECKAGQQVWMRHLHGAHDSGYLANLRSSWSSFSGHLVAAL